MIYLKHEKHGYHVVYSEADAVKHEKVGWKRFDLAEEHAAARRAKGLDVVKEEKPKAEEKPVKKRKKRKPESYK